MGIISSSSPSNKSKPGAYADVLVMVHRSDNPVDVASGWNEWNAPADRTFHAARMETTTAKYVNFIVLATKCVFVRMYIGIHQGDMNWQKTGGIEYMFFCT
jgi:hypothetical protein